MYARSKRYPFGRSLSRPVIRLLTVGLYAGYPAGCVLQLLPATGAGLWAHFAGLALVVVAVGCFLSIATSSLQRQSQEVDAQLDERERAERDHAGYRAHALFSCFVLVGILYIALVSDLVSNGKADLWLPQGYEGWNAIFWGAMMLALTLPAAVLGWRRGLPELD